MKHFTQAQNPDFPVFTEFQTALPALLANGAAVENADALPAEYAGWLQECAESASCSMMAALAMMSRLAEANRHAPEHSRVDVAEVAAVLRDMAAVAGETAPVLMRMAVDLALAGGQNVEKGE